jgi:uncharacterized protein YebE (UPF0316 family)
MAIFIQSAFILFILRTIDISFYTLRILMMVRGRKILAWVFGFCQSLTYINALKLVMADLDSWMNIAGYAAGFATGLVLGMTVEKRLHLGFLHLRIISRNRGQVIAETLRANGFGVTEIAAVGRDGAVELMHCSIHRQDLKRIEKIVDSIDTNAFITSEAVRPLNKGYWGD